MGLLGFVSLCIPFKSSRLTCERLLDAVMFDQVSVQKGITATEAREYLPPTYRHSLHLGTWVLLKQVRTYLSPQYESIHQ